MKRFRVIKHDYRFKSIEKTFDNLTDAMLYMEDLDGEVILQQLADDDTVIEEWKKRR